MDILRKIFRMKRQKPYKIQDPERKIGRLGITASSLNDLKKKAADKFSVPTSEMIVVLEEDGTEVHEERYFETLPEQTAFVILRKGQFWDGCKLICYYVIQFLMLLPNYFECSNLITNTT